MKIKSEEQIQLENEQQKEQDASKINEQEEYNKTLFQKIRHFWTYEKWKVIIPVICVLIVFSFVKTYLDETKELSLCIAMVNARMDSPDSVTFQNDFARDSNLDTDAYPIRIETGMIHPQTMDAQQAANQMVVASVQKYQNFVTTGMVDVTIADEWMIAEYEKANVYLNLEEVLSKECFEKISDRLVYFENQEGKKIPVGIRITNYDEINKFYENEPVMALSASSGRQENAVMFVEWLEKGLSK